MNVAIDLAATVRVRPADLFRVRQGESVVEAASAAELMASPEGSLVAVVAAAFQLPPVEVELASQSPRGGGLGGSSALVRPKRRACSASRAPSQAPSAFTRAYSARRAASSWRRSSPSGSRSSFSGSPVAGSR